MDSRFLQIRALNTPMRFLPPSSAEEWRGRASKLSRRVLAVAGLVPMPPRPAVRPRVVRTLDREGYRVQALWFPSGRGLCVAGNLYLPEGDGPFPAVLHPHGHWEEGRIADDTDGSSQAFCTSLARSGFAAFAWDMIGYNDTLSLPHDFCDRRAARSGVTLLGLQLWNSIRALDFLSVHPRVDALRIGIAGASGGATQALLLSAVDDRVRAAALVCMVSCRMQGGCVCENAPGLRIDAGNVELAACMAPRPLLLVSARGDWTREAGREDFPALSKVYRLLGAGRNVRHVRFDLPHNLLRESREAATEWFALHLGGRARREQPCVAEPREALLCFGDRERFPLPRGRALVGMLVEETKGRFRADAEAARALLGIEVPAAFVGGRGWLGRKGVGDRVPFRWMGKGEPVTLVVHDGGPAWKRAAARTGRALVIDVFGVGRSRGPDRRKAHARVVAPFFRQLGAWSSGGAPPRVRCSPEDYFDAYNRTDDALRVQDVVTALWWLARGRRRVRLFARGRAASWARLALLFAPPGAQADLAGRGSLDVPCAAILQRAFDA